MLNRTWTFKQVNDPKLINQSTKEWLKKKKWNYSVKAQIWNRQLIQENPSKLFQLKDFFLDVGQKLMLEASEQLCKMPIRRYFC